MERDSLEQKLQQLHQERERLVVLVHQHDGAIAMLSRLLADNEPKQAVSKYPMAVNATTTQ